MLKSDHVMRALRIGDLTAPLPIIQGGMGVAISLSGLAAAVANEGGIGVIATAGIGMSESDLFSNFLEANIRALRKEIRRARELSKGIIGVNIMVALSNYADLVRTAIEEKIDIIFSGAGLPMNLPEYLKGSTTKLVPIVSSGRAAAILCRRWLNHYNYLPDAIVVEGPMAGGHLGFKIEHIDDPAYALEKLVPEVLKEVRVFEEKSKKTIPVIAGGGIYTGEDILRFLQMGAAGVQMATRFVTTDECDASAAFKQMYLDAKEEDLIIIKSPVGMPGRAIRNGFLDEVGRGEKMPFRCPYHCIVTCDYENSPYCIALALVNAKRGIFKHGYAFAGKNAYRAKAIVPIKRLIETLTKEYAEAVKKLKPLPNPTR
jgi:NAD(P)H-dependent flavin oxidoreductase YrpB (nitropropane dioxygenase family)